MTDNRSEWLKVPESEYGNLSKAYVKKSRNRLLLKYVVLALFFISSFGFSESWPLSFYIIYMGATLSLYMYLGASANMLNFKAEIMKHINAGTIDEFLKG